MRQTAFLILIGAGLPATGSMPVYAEQATTAILRPHQVERQQLFEERRAIESFSHRERIRILSEAEECIQAATNVRAYHLCERQEQAARQALRAEIAPRLQAFRERKVQLVQRMRRRD